jgi:hypothetical protein
MQPAGQQRQSNSFGTFLRALRLQALRSAFCYARQKVEVPQNCYSQKQGHGAPTWNRPLHSHLGSDNSHSAEFCRHLRGR